MPGMSILRCLEFAAIDSVTEGPTSESTVTPATVGLHHPDQSQGGRNRDAEETGVWRSRKDSEGLAA
eukprot:144494-Rhodomonas_salina.1